MQWNISYSEIEKAALKFPWAFMSKWLKTPGTKIAPWAKKIYGATTKGMAKPYNSIRKKI